MTPAWVKSIEHRFKRIVFAIARLLLKKGRHDFSRIDANTIKRVLLIRPERLGDMIISLPVMYNLKMRYPHLELYVICSPTSLAVMKHDPKITKNFLYTKKPLTDIAMLREIRRLKMDAVLDLIYDDSVTALFLSQLTARGKAYRLGVGKRSFQSHYDYTTACRTGHGGEDGFARSASECLTDTRHVIDITAEVLTVFGFNTDNLERHVPPAVTNNQIKMADAFIDSLKADNDAELIGYNISAGRPNRIWQEEKNRELISRLLDTYPSSRIIISFDPKEWSRAVALADHFDDRVKPLPAGLSLLDVTAVIRRLTLLITPDTSLVHIARSFKVPVVGLYTNYDYNFLRWKPYNQEVGAVVSHTENNIFDITVDEVYDTVRKVLPVGSSI